MFLVILFGLICFWRLFGQLSPRLIILHEDTTVKPLKSFGKIKELLQVQPPNLHTHPTSSISGISMFANHYEAVSNRVEYLATLAKLLCCKLASNKAVSEAWQGGKDNSRISSIGGNSKIKNIEKAIECT